jgi:hypothetical protein
MRRAREGSGRDKLIGRRELALGLTAAAAQANCSAPVTTEPQTPAAPGTSQPGASPTAPVLSVRELLARNRTRDPEYRGGLSNHQSMALGALIALGADAAHLNAFANQYDERLEPLRKTSELASPDFRAALGTRAAFGALSERFERHLGEHGRDALLREVLPETLPGLAGAAFHGVIRTAYALEAEDDAELAHGLAYLVATAKPLSPLPKPRAGATARPAELVARAAADQRLEKGLFGGLITDSMRAAARQEHFDEYMTELQVAPETLDELAGVALEFYVHDFDFTSLHTVTGTHALRLLLPYLSDPEPALRYLFQALLAATLTQSGRSEYELETEPPDWPVLAEKARASPDEHDAKFIFTCREEAAVRTPDAYRRAAAQRLRL